MSANEGVTTSVPKKVSRENAFGLRGGEGGLLLGGACS